MKCHVPQNCPKSQTSSLNLNVSIKSAKDNWVRKSSKIYVRKSQIRKLPHLRKVRIKKKMKSKNLRICDLRTLFADHPPLCIWKRKQCRLYYKFIIPYIIICVRYYVQDVGSTLAGCILSGNQDYRNHGTTQYGCNTPPPFSPTILVKPAGYRRINHSFHTRQLITELIIGDTVQYFT